MYVSASLLPAASNACHIVLSPNLIGKHVRTGSLHAFAQMLLALNIYRWR